MSTWRTNDGREIPFIDFSGNEEGNPPRPKGGQAKEGQDFRWIAPTRKGTR